MNIDYWNLLITLMPETLLVLTAFLILFLDLFRFQERTLEDRAQIASVIACAGCAIAVVWIGLFPNTLRLEFGVLVVDLASLWVKLFLLLLTIFTVLLFPQQSFTRYPAEYLALILMASVGMMFMVSSEHLLMIFVALETASLSLYTLVGFHKGKRFSPEAALKYFLFGGLSAALTLYGISLLFGLAGNVDFDTLRRQLPEMKGEPLFAAGLVMVAAGLGFKVAAAPFHLWAPDAYEGAPISSAVLVAAGSKVAAFFLLGKLMIQGLDGAEGSAAWHGMQSGWMPVLAVMALASMILGNLAALAQKNIKRLVAYSAVAHSGYALVGILSGSEQGLAALLYYVVLYGFTVVGLFAVIQFIEGETGDSALHRFAGLGQHNPGLSVCLLIFVLSLAGIPPLAGFFGKFYLFAAALNTHTGHSGLLWLVMVGLLMSAVSLYYYLQILKQVYVVEPEPNTVSRKVPFTVLFVVMTMAAIVVLFGCLPDLMLNMIHVALQPIGSP